MWCARWNYTTGGKAKSRMPITSLLRPVMVLLQSRSTQRALYDIAAATWMSRQMLLFAMFVFVASVVTGSALVGAIHDPSLEDRAAALGTGFGSVQKGVFFLMRRSHSIGFTKAQGIPKYKIGFGRGKGWEGWGYLAWPLCWPLVSSKIGGRWE